LTGILQALSGTRGRGMLAPRPAVERSLEAHGHRILVEGMSWKDGSFNSASLKVGTSPEHPTPLPEGVRNDALRLGLAVHLTGKNADRETAAAKAGRELGVGSTS